MPENRLLSRTGVECVGVGGVSHEEFMLMSVTVSWECRLRLESLLCIMKAFRFEWREDVDRFLWIAGVGAAEAEEDVD